ncbi:MAG: potassium channel family protein [Sphingomonadales bacterium]
MANQLFIGTVLVLLTAVVHGSFIAAAVVGHRKLYDWFLKPPHFFKTMSALTITISWVVVAHSIETWLWAFMFLWLGIFDALEPAVYFALISFTTLGFGDIILEPKWRLFSGIAAANGLILFGVSTAFLMEIMRRLREHQGHKLGPS